MDLVGELLMDDGSHTPYYSPPFSREGLAATFVADVTHKRTTSGLVLLLSLEHKNLADTTWSTAGSFAAISTIGVATKDITGLKEILRWVAAFSNGSAGEFYWALFTAAWRQYA